MRVGQCYEAEDVVCPQIFLHATAAARHSLLGFAKKLKRGRGPIDIVCVVKGDLKMSKLVHYHRLGKKHLGGLHWGGPRRSRIFHKGVSGGQKR